MQCEVKQRIVKQREEGKEGISGAVQTLVALWSGPGQRDQGELVGSALAGRRGLAGGKYGKSR